MAFIDGQNLFHAARETFGYSYPNYDADALARHICGACGWFHQGTYFYTGIPDRQVSARWNHFWERKLAVMGTRGVRTFSRPLRYRNQIVSMQDGSTTAILIGEEKGIDVRIALDIVRLARVGGFDVAVLFSQDQDLSEVADEVRSISREQDRWIRIVSVFPVSATSRNKRGVNNTEWIQLDRTSYDACLDPIDYRLKRT